MIGSRQDIAVEDLRPVARANKGTKVTLYTTY